MDLRLLARKAIDAVRHHGLRHAVQQGIRMVLPNRPPDEFDRLHGTDTAGIEPLWRFRIDSANARFGVRYQTTDPQHLVDAIEFLKLKPARLTFVDLGCGKGRTLVVAGKLGFKRIVGVEFVPELAAIARANLEKARIVNAAVAEGDAAEYAFPSGDVALYLNNPFAEPVMRKVIDRLPHDPGAELYVLYHRPECANLFDRVEFLERVDSSAACSEMRIWVHRAGSAASDTFETPG
jgi:SAM-dependent methyltransferase